MKEYKLTNACFTNPSTQLAHLIRHYNAYIREGFLECANSLLSDIESLKEYKKDHDKKCKQ